MTSPRGRGNAGSEKPAASIASLSPRTPTDILGSRNATIPSFQACTMCLAMSRHRYSFLAASITS